MITFASNIKEPPSNPSMEMPAKAGADGNRLKDTDQSTTGQWTANTWEADYFLT